MESSADHLWTPVCTLPVDEGMAHYIDPDSTDLPSQFYRVVPVPTDPED